MVHHGRIPLVEESEDEGSAEEEKKRTPSGFRTETRTPSSQSQQI